jgi:hypothetical protein
MIRIATISAVAALSIGASAATASARPCSCDGDAAQDAQVTQAWIKAQRHLPPAHPLLARIAPQYWWVPRGFDALNLLLAKGHFYPSMGWL